MDASNFAESISIDNRDDILETKRTRKSSRQKNLPFSTRVYGIEWDKYFPKKFTSSRVSVHHSNFESCAQFLSANYSQLDSSNEYDFKPIYDGSDAAKANYYKELGDFFEFRSEGELIGSFIGTPIDWSSYYLRAVIFTEKNRDKKVFQEFMLYFLDVLRQNGIARAEGDVSSSNLINVHVLNKLKFNITGISVTERWGTFIKFTKFLNPTNEKRFLNRFCHGIRPQLD